VAVIEIDHPADTVGEGIESNSKLLILPGRLEQNKRRFNSPRLLLSWFVSIGKKRTSPHIHPGVC
jgi:hypothetical protein